MMVHLGAQRPLDHRLRHLIQHTIRTVQRRPGRLSISQDPVDRLRRDQLRQPPRRLLPQSSTAPSALSIVT
jgi:hypothetical protein